jgi:hypothetical protein
MRFFFNLVVLLLTIAAATAILFGGTVRIVPGTGSVAGATRLDRSPLDWRAADMRLLMEANHYKCGYVANEPFEFDAAVGSESRSTRGTVFAGTFDTIETPTGRVRKHHEAADNLWCDLGNVNVAGFTTPPGKSLDVRDIFVIKDGIIVEFHVLVRVVEPSPRPNTDRLD